MFRRVLIAFLATLAFAGAAFAFVTRRDSGKRQSDGPVQWPFDPAELRALMDRVIDEQRERIGRIEDPTGRRKARAFLTYYERRRAAASSA
jgi:hypothetical protein